MNKGSLLTLLLILSISVSGYGQTPATYFVDEDSLTQAKTIVQIKSILDERLELVSKIVRKHLSRNFPDSLRRTDRSPNILEGYPYELNQDCFMPLTTDSPKMIMMTTSFLDSLSRRNEFSARGLAHLDNKALEAVLLGVFCHETGHALLFELQKRALEPEYLNEYQADILSGYLGAKVLWEPNKDVLLASCNTKQSELVARFIPELLVAVMLKSDINAKRVLGSSYPCLKSFFNGYKLASVLTDEKNTAGHGMGCNRKKAFDYGIMFALLDGFNLYTSSEAYKQSTFRHLSNVKTLRKKFVKLVETELGLTTPDLTKIGQYDFISCYTNGQRYVSQLASVPCEN